jgi:hypothetical protein
MAHDTSRSRHLIRAADIHHESTAMVSDSSIPVSDFNAHPTTHAEPSAWIDRTSRVADVVRLDALRGALGRLANVVWSVAKAPALPIGALMESNALLGLHPTRGEFFEPDPYAWRRQAGAGHTTMPRRGARHA